MQYSNRRAKTLLTFLSWGLFFLLVSCQPQQTPLFVGKSAKLSTGQKYRVQCPNGLPGDLNADASIDILDVIAMVNIILGTVESNGCADLNADGVVTLLDIVVLATMILDDSEQEADNGFDQDAWPGNGPSCEGECEPNSGDDDNDDDGEEDEPEPEPEPEPFSCKVKDLACPGEPGGVWQDGNGGQGIGCDWYAGAAWRCGDYADDWPNPNCGLTANEACGVCGGGFSAPDLKVIHMNIGRMSEHMVDVRYKCGSTGEVYDDPWQSYSNCRSDCSGGPYDCTALNPVSFEECGSCIGNGVCTRTREEEIAEYISQSNPDVINFTEAYITDNSCESGSCSGHWNNPNSPCYDNTSDPYYGLDQLDRLVGNTKAMYDAGTPLYNIECVEYSCVAVKAPLELTHGMFQVKTDECLNADGTYARGNLGYNCIDTSGLGDYSNVKVISAHPDHKRTYEADVCRKSIYKAMYEDIPEANEHVLILGDMNTDPYRYNVGNFIDWSREGKCSNPQFNGDKGGCCTDASQTYGTGSWDGDTCTKCYWDGNGYDDCVESSQFSDWTPGSVEYLEGFYRWLANHIRINQVELHEVVDVSGCGSYTLHSWNFEHQVSAVDLKITNPSGNEVDITQSNASEEYYNLETSAYMTFSNRSRACNPGLCPSLPPLTGCSGNDHYFSALISGWVGITFRLDKDNSAPSITSIDVSDLDLYV
ncbi:MAG: dockerin type I repeat-containing protein, partial [Myxococcota bacterium]|nr:dockerin type I repeat-containing protein [Myxococcota bacterium]